MLKSSLKSSRLRSIYLSTNWIRNLSDEQATNDLISENALKREKNQINQQRKTNYLNQIENLNFQNQTTEKVSNDDIFIMKDPINEIEYEIEHQNSKLNDHLLSTNQSKQNQLSINDQLINKIELCEDISNLLNTIEPHLNELTTDDLKLIFTKIHLMLRYSIFNQSIDEFRNIILNSFIFNSLINRISELKDFEVKCLLIIFRVFSELNVDGRLKSCQFVLNSLKLRLEEFDFTDIRLLWKSLKYYPNYSISKNELTFELTKSLRQLAAKKLFECQFNTGERHDLIFSLNILYDDQEIVSILVKQLSNDLDLLNYKQLIYLIKYLKKIREPKLLDKCNSHLIKHITEDTTKRKEKVIYYINKVHDTLDGNINDMMYNSKLLDILTPIILDNKSIISKRKVFQLIYNFGKLKIYNEQILKLVYDWIFTHDNFTKNLNITKFLFFIKYKFPFVNSNLLARRLFLNSTHIQDSNHNNLIKFLSFLILSDVTYAKIYEFFFDNFTTSDLIKNFQIKSKESDCQLINFAKVYLEYSQLDDRIKNQLIYKLNNYIDEISKIYKRFPFYRSTLYNNEILFNAYLSNGILLKQIVIYDKRINDLISLYKFKDYYFNKIEQIPINSDQCICTFLFKYHLRGTINQYEHLYDYQWTRILNKYNIKLIDIECDYPVQKIEDKNKPKFFIQKAIDNFKKT